VSVTIDEIRAVVREELGRPKSPWMNTEQAADYVGSTAASLKNFRATGQGPAYRACSGRMIRYHVEDLDRWVRTGER
jgi:hypothetical protein